MLTWDGILPGPLYLVCPDIRPIRVSCLPAALFIQIETRIEILQGFQTLSFAVVQKLGLVMLDRFTIHPVAVKSTEAWERSFCANL